MDSFASSVFRNLGLPTEDVGGASCRIGGASDIRRAVGIVRGKELLQERGRWQSDIGWIYQRGDLGEQLTLSADMSYACGRTIEECVPGWAQPARRG